MQLTKILLFLAVQLLCAIPKTSAQFQFLYNICGDNDTTPSTYQKNLNTTLSSMSSDTSITYGYYNFTAGNGSDKVEAMALCRSDISVDNCRVCVQSSVDTITRVCPDVKQAFGYSDNCWIYYTNYSAFHYPEDQLNWALRFNGNVTGMPNFNTSLLTLMNNLTHQASLGNSQTKFATGKISFPNNKSLYGLVQCSPDLSRYNCSTCVQYLISSVFSSYFITLTNGSLFMAEGGRVVSPSCFLRYELYPFYHNVTYVAPSQQPRIPPSPTSKRNTTSAQAVKSSTSHKALVIAAPIGGSLVVAIVIIASICFLLSRKKQQRKLSGKFSKEELDALESLQFSIGAIKVATDNFADTNKLGEGGFGIVYKGKLPDGQEIAVKRFKRDVTLGDVQFQNEILTLAKLHHRNLVRLLGFCLEEEEMILIYEFVINKSLDNFLFDPIHHESMDWETRFKIINGVARGLNYLHEDSRSRIIHRDLKAANILLDANFNPKITDFGTAKLFKTDQSQTVTSNVVGTHGYMPPEYLIKGQVSMKSDVFGFGVLILEILSGQSIGTFQIGENPENLLAFAWKNWQEGKAWSLVDPSLSNASKAEIERCIHIGLLCVQNNMGDRPPMSSVTLMLSSFSTTLDAPSQPAFFTQIPMLLNLHSQQNASDQSKSTTYSKNEITLTKPFGR